MDGRNYTLVGGPFDGKWLLSPDAPTIWVRRREDGLLGYLTEPATNRARYDVEDDWHYVFTDERLAA